jgi:hypothetical protein
MFSQYEGRRRPGRKKATLILDDQDNFGEPNEFTSFHADPTETLALKELEREKLEGNVGELYVAPSAVDVLEGGSEHPNLAEEVVDVGGQGGGGEESDEDATEEEARRVFAAIDTNNSGTITMGEFMVFYNEFIVDGSLSGAFDKTTLYISPAPIVIRARLSSLHQSPPLVVQRSLLFSRASILMATLRSLSRSSFRVGPRGRPTGSPKRRNGALRWLRLDGRALPTTAILLLGVMSMMRVMMTTTKRLVCL